MSDGCQRGNYNYRLYIYNHSLIGTSRWFFAVYSYIYIVFQNIQLDIFKNDGSLMDLFWINLKQFMYCFVDPPAIFEF